MKKEIIVLTRSIKHGGFCVAGIENDGGSWIRVVSSDVESEGAVSRETLKYTDGTEVAVYDIIEVEVIKAIPTSVQPENWLYDEKFPWKKVGKSNISDVLKLHGYDSPNSVFGNTDVSLPADWKFEGKPSLLLLEIPKAHICVKTFQERTVSLNFQYNGDSYNYMRISQKDILTSAREDGLYPIGKKSIVFSLTDRYYYTGKYYKIIAQILE